MKVCYLLTHNPDTTGGIETVVKNLSQGDDVKWIGCGGACSIAKGFFTALKLRFSDYDLIHAHDNAGYWLTRLARNKKIVWTAQGLWKNYFEENPPRGVRKRLEALILARMQERLVKKSDAVVPINRSIEKRLSDPRIKLTEIVPNGVDTDKYYPSKSQKEFDYIWVSTNPDKARLKETLEFVKGKKMLAVGIEGPGAENTTYAKIPREKMPGTYNSAESLVYFSKQDDYPLVMLEAMACGLNIITTEQILTQLTGLGERIGSINLDGKDFAIVFLPAKEARETALEFDWKKIRARYKKIYEALVSI